MTFLNVGMKRMNMREMSLPYVRMKKLIEFLLLIHDNPDETFDSMASKKVLLTKTNLQNLAYSAKSLDLVTINKKRIKLTTNGESFTGFIKINNEKSAKELLRKIIQKNEALSRILGLLKKEKILTTSQIGAFLADKYEKKWKDEKTYLTYGASCASIIDFADLGILSRNALSVPGVEQPQRIHIPELTSSKALTILNEVHDSKQINIKHLSKKVGTPTYKLISEIVGMIELGLIQKSDNDLYSTTKNGSRILNPFEIAKRKKILKECILYSKFGSFVSSLLGKKFTAIELGRSLDFRFHRKWGKEHTRKMGTIFLSWLKEADLVKKIGRGRYTLKLIDPKETYSDLEYAEKNLKQKMYPPALVMCRRAYEGILIKKYKLTTGEEPIVKKYCKKCKAEIGKFPIGISNLHNWAVDNNFIPEELKGVGHTLAKVGVIGAHPYEETLDREDVEFQIAQTRLLIAKMLKD